MRMLDYVKMAQDRLAQNVATSRDLTDELVKAYVKAGSPSVRIIACGSSRNASLMARDYMQPALRVPVTVVTPEAYVTYDHSQPADAFELFVTQSGFSTNTLAAIDFARSNGRTAIALTGNPDTPVADHADLVVDWGVGLESVGFVTMGVQTLVAFLIAFAAFAAHASGRMDTTRLADALASLKAAVHAHAGALDAADLYVSDNALELSRKVPTMVVGAGPLYGVACEASLKINECLKRPAMMHEPEEFVHGPEMQIDPTYQLFLLEPPCGDDRVAQLAQTFAGICPTTLVTFDAARANASAARTVVLPQVPDHLMAAIPALVPFQWMAARLMDDLKCEDVHPLLEAREDDLAVKAAGYKAAVDAAAKSADALYGSAS